MPPGHAERIPLDEDPHLPLTAAVADVVAGLLLFGAVIIAMIGRLRFHLGGIRISIASPWRAVLYALAILAIRHWLVPRRPIHKRFLDNTADLNERRLFGVLPVIRSRAIGQILLVTAAFAVLVGVATWPQLGQLDSVPDFGDPLFSVWRLAWVAHQLPRAPLHLFDANIFYPERLTFTYSDPVLIPALLGAPFFWLGFSPVAIYNVLLLSGFVLSGTTMFLLVHALTGRKDAAAIAGVVFALYPFRFDHYHHLELQMTMWMPLTLWGFHRTIARGRLRDGILTGVAFAGQVLSSLYYGVFLATYLVAIGAVLWLSRRTRRPLIALAAGAALAAVIVAPVAAEYISNRDTLGERFRETIQAYSATPDDYLTPNAHSFFYSANPEDIQAERPLFPGIAPVALSVVALWPPLSVARLGYAIALGVAFDGSLGFNSGLYTWLHAHLRVFRGLRVPARYAVLVGFSLAVLAGYGATRLLEAWPRWRYPLVAIMLAVVVVEPWPRLSLKPVWKEPPSIYSALPPGGKAILAEFPMERYLDLDDTRYMYFSIFHWNHLVNGYSGFAPPSHYEMLYAMKRFPGPTAIEDLRSRGVEYIAVHGAFYPPEDYQRIVRVLDARPDMMLVSAAEWGGAESRMYRLQPRGW